MNIPRIVWQAFAICVVLYLTVLFVVSVGEFIHDTRIMMGGV